MVFGMTPIPARAESFTDGFAAETENTNGDAVIFSAEEPETDAPSQDFTVIEPETDAAVSGACTSGDRGRI